MNLLLTRSQTLYPLSSVEGMEKCKRIVDVEGGIEFFLREYVQRDAS